MMWHIARQGCYTSHCPFGRAMAASQLDKFVALGSVCYCSAHGSYLRHSWSSLDEANAPSRDAIAPKGANGNATRQNVAQGNTPDESRAPDPAICREVFEEGRLAARSHRGRTGLYPGRGFSSVSRAAWCSAAHVNAAFYMPNRR
jgi:hypothetical protein